MVIMFRGKVILDGFLGENLKPQWQSTGTRPVSRCFLETRKIWKRRSEPVLFNLNRASYQISQRIKSLTLFCSKPSLSNHIRHDEVAVSTEIIAE